MKREFKFRGRSKQTGKWLYGDLLRIGKYVFIVPYDGDWLDFIPRDDIFHLPSAEYTVIPETVGQYIGKKDKNGKEIYEGDIMQYNAILRPSKYYRYVIAWNPMEMAFGCASLEHAFSDCPDISGGAQITDSIIVGNIHDNKELLERESI